MNTAKNSQYKLWHKLRAILYLAGNSNYFQYFDSKKLLKTFIAIALILSNFSTNASAQGRSISLVRDAEIEALVRDYARPLLKAAGLRPDVEVILVNDMSFNAFVDGVRIFVNVGALMQSETPNEIIGVIAHEIGHLAGGHQHRLREQMKRAQTMAVIGMLVGIGAGVAGSSTGNSDAGAAGGAIAMGSSDVAMRTLMAYQRGEESAADRSAINYLNKTQQSAKGMLTTFDRLGRSLNLSGSRIDPYRSSHPLPPERIAAIQTLAKQSPYFEKKDPADLQLRHDMARAKIAGNMGRTSELRRMFAANPRSLPARYGDTIIAVANARPQDGVAKAKALLKEQPQNAYFQELLGDALLRANDAQGAAEAYKRASSLDKSRSSLLRINYGRALLATNKPSNLTLAISEIKSGLRNEPSFASGYGVLAQAYGRQGQTGLADLATADMYYYGSEYKQARIFAVRAQRSLKPNSAEWLRAQDILTTTENRKDKDK
ncbi:M48 family metalloprotease [Bartonella sp. HY038]|uniref:M48 family metalloprotease n=1 Tax=Bartonella sp. HY038 TaxID=2759660 RepID=UPI0015FA23FC|nr:M48 family metalloprotease [Bartonella sp. HY038]